jgi:hypothetical protein
MSLFSAQNRVPLTVPGGVAAQPSIQVDSNLRRWFSRNLGLWRSRRQYTFSDDQVLHLDMNLKMEAFAHPEVGEPVRTRLRQVDEHETILESHYQQWDILEHIRLVDQDRYRYRAIYSWENGDLSIVEHHHEIRMSDPLPLIEDD